MLLNLTNHPFHRWPPDQRRAAERRWGTVRDLPFPAVSRRYSREVTRGQVVVKTSEYRFHAFRAYPAWPWQP